SSGISNEEYPFAVDDHGKAALLDYYSQISHRPMELPADMPSPDALDGHNELLTYTQAGNDSSLIVEEIVSSSPAVDDGILLSNGDGQVVEETVLSSPVVDDTVEETLSSSPVVDDTEGETALPGGSEL